jgi:hypothetical protein
MAASKLVTLPYQMVLSFCFVRRHVTFRWRELWLAIWKSAVVTASSALAPLCAVALSGSRFDLSLAASAGALPLAAAGWMAGVVLTRHPVLLELKLAAERLSEAALVRRLRPRIMAPGPRTGEVR